MPLEFDDPDGDGVLRPSADRFGKPKAPWWRPASTVGRVFLTASALLVLGGFTTASLLLAHYVERDARFRIAGSSNIQAAGLAELSRADLMPVFGEDIGCNVFFIPLDKRRRELEGIPWIEHATVMRVLPDQIRVAVVERRPVAFTQHGQTIGLVDASGVLLSMAPKTMAERHYSFPVVTGLDPGDSAESRKARMTVYLRLMTELDADGKRNSQQISEIDLTDPEDARVIMPEQGSDILVHLGEEKFLSRFERYKANIAAWRQQYPHLKSVDLRFDHYDDRVILQMASGAETPEAPGDGKTATGTAPEAHTPSSQVAKSSTSKPAAKKNKPAPASKHVAPKRTAKNANATSARKVISVRASRSVEGG
ncbi:MAG: FtsQ-type POTRA domain-containing protein [Terracidiphilus sp.]|nr:FtsQ-type POTRA domain-containing protein [Terracidiphilus sp.]